jgi:hypothetical protein
MHAKIQCMNMHRSLQIKFSSFAFLEFYIMQYCTNKILVKSIA